MQHNEPGVTLSLPRVGLGGNVFGHFCDQEETRDLLSVALDGGINLVDTSDTYSDGLSETYIGNAIHRHRQQWIIATKAGIRSDEPPHGLGRAGHIRRKIAQSLRRLRTDWIDLYQMHHFDPETPLEETLSALEELRREGKVRYVGVSNYSAAQLSKALEVARRIGITPISAVQNHFNMLKREGEADWLPLCRHEDIRVLVYGALARGILGGQYTADSPLPAGSRASRSESVRGDLRADVLATVNSLSKLADTLSLKVGQLAIAWTLSRPGVSTVVIGVRNVRQLNDHVRAKDITLGTAELSAIEYLLGPATRFSDLRLGSYGPT